MAIPLKTAQSYNPYTQIKTYDKLSGQLSPTGYISPTSSGASTIQSKADQANTIFGAVTAPNQSIRPPTISSVAPVTQPVVQTVAPTTQTTSQVYQNEPELSPFNVTVSKGNDVRQIQASQLETFKKAGFIEGTTTPEPTTTEPTVSQVYDINSYASPEDQALNDAYSKYAEILNTQTATVDEEKIRQDTLARFQAEIDALDRLYTEKKAQEAVAGQGRLGQEGAIEAKRGLLGSTFGTAQTAKVEGYNKSIQDAYDAELSAKKSAILTEARDDAQKEIEAKTQARLSGAKDYIDFLNGQATRKDERLNSTIQNLIGSSVEPNEEDYKTLAETLGTTVANLKTKYKELYDKSLPEQKAVFTVAPGSSIFDPNTGEFLGTAPEKPSDNKPVTQEVGNSLLQYDPTTNSWNVQYSEADKPNYQKIGDVTYQVDAQGNFTPVKLPVSTQANTQAITEAKQKISVIDEILNDPNLDAVVGVKGIGTLLPYAAKVKNKIDQLIGDLVLDERGRLKGSGAISDFETKIIKQAATALGRNLSNEDFRTVLNDVKEKFANVEKSSYLSQIEGITQDEAALQLEQMKEILGSYPTTEELQQIYPSFNQDLSKSIKGTLGNIASTKYPQGYKGGQCGDFAHKLVSFPSVGNGLNDKKASVDKFGIPKSQWNPQTSDVVISSDNPTYGHVMVLDKQISPTQWTIIDSNYKGDGKVAYGRIININDPKIYGAIRGNIKI